jgi:hypothetical protein
MATYSTDTLSLSGSFLKQSMYPACIPAISSEFTGDVDSEMNCFDVTSELLSHEGENTKYNSSATYIAYTSTGNQAKVQHRPWLLVNTQNYGHDPIASNHLLSSLQSALQDECTPECAATQTALVDTISSPYKQSSAVPLSVHIGHLHMRFMDVTKYHKTKVTELDQFYRIQSTDIETARLTNLQSAITYNTWIAASINAYYDHIHHALIDRILQSLDSLKNISSHKVEQFNVHPGITSSQLPYQHLSNDRPEENAPKYETSTSPTGQCKPRYRRKGFLNPVAVRIMSAWYQNNSEHPYPSYEAAQVMAEAGEITVDQVKKWFANHRRRSRNTKPMKEIAHRRKVMKRTRSSMESAADDIFLTDAKRSRDS